MKPDKIYKKLLPYFEKANVNCALIGREVGLANSTVLTYYSRYLNKLMANSPSAKIPPVPKKELCPSCGREKADLGVPKCRDYFHYVDYNK